jgi:hypothetical protein
VATHAAKSVVTHDRQTGDLAHAATAVEQLVAAQASQSAEIPLFVPSDPPPPASTPP